LHSKITFGKKQTISAKRQVIMTAYSGFCIAIHFLFVDLFMGQVL